MRITDVEVTCESLNLLIFLVVILMLAEPLRQTGH
jgi:hypothetical protein